MRKPGASDAYMYYVNIGSGKTMDCKMPFVLAAPVNMEALQLAAKEALDVFPEFAVRPVVKDEELYLEENKSPVVVMPADDKGGNISLDYGCEDTNGHILYFLVDEEDKRRVTFCYFHGMSDFAGAIAFLKTVLYRYALKQNPGLSVSGEALEGAGIRSSIPKNWECAENLDPYTYFSREPEENGEAKEPPLAFSPKMDRYPMDSEYSHIIEIACSTSAFHQKTKLYHTSFAPLLVSVLSEAVADYFSGENENIIAAFPVDIRKIYGAETVTNFSDSVLFLSSPSLRKEPKEEECKAYRKMMDAQRTAGHMDAFLYEKKEVVKGWENSKKGYLSVCREIAAPAANGQEAPLPFTFLITYPGRLDMPEFLSGTVSYMGLEMVNSGLNFAFIAFTYGDDMVIQLIQNFDGTGLAEAVQKALKKKEIDAVINDRGRRRQNCFRPEKLKKVQE